MSITKRDTKKLRDLLVSSDIAEFIKSSYGARRLAKFLNRIQEYREQFKDFFYYEDPQEIFLKEVSRLFGFPEFKISFEQMENIKKNNSKRVNLRGTKHSLLTPELEDHIQETLYKHCKLPEYRDRYL